MGRSVEINLEPFGLLEPIGQGGMGEVWRGVYHAQQVPVAVKVLTSKAALDPRFLTAFRNEVRAAAGLDHPNVVLVLDYGTVSPEASLASGGRLVEGSPFLVTELLQGGSLRRQIGQPLPWARARDVLLTLLDALAHAHARGVVHLDVKPDNVLIGASSDARPGLKLTDFGLAQALVRQELDGSGLFAGTPMYMAPEQFSGMWRDFGPWTDLYALGVLAWALLTGRPLWDETEYGSLQQAHLYGELPPLKLRMAAPAGVEVWLRRLLEKDPLRRYQRAADAAWALLSLGDAPELILDLEPSDESLAQATRSRATAIQALMSMTTTADRRGRTAEGWLDLPYDGPTGVGLHAEDLPFEEDLSDEDTQPVFPSAPPMPSDWEIPAPPAPSLRLRSAGLRLYWLRSLPLVDREAERDALWDALWEVRELRQTRAVILRGSHGVGKSRLVEWLCERSHEVGAASWLKATHSPSPGSSDGLAPMLARYLRCASLGREAVQSRVSAWLRRRGVLGVDEAAALTELICPASEGDRAQGPVGFSFSKPLERYAVVRRMLERLSHERPLVVWLDDAQWGSDAVRFASYLMGERNRASLPALVVLTARDEALSDRPDEAQLLQDLEARPGTLSLQVGPLPEDHRVLLVSELLGLASDLAVEVAERTGGNPLFAVQMVGDWVQRGALTLGEDGFRMRERPELPDDLHQVWARRVLRVLEGYPAEEGVALELAAALGQDVVGEEWAALCRLLRIEPPWGLVERLLRERLARPIEGTPDLGWTFVHGMLRESLERRAREGGRLARHHLAAANLLVRRSGYGIAERVGRHLVGAGHLEEALDPLLQGARERRASADYGHAEALLRERERAMVALKLPPEDARWGLGQALQSRLSLMRGDREQADGLAAAAEGAARRHGWSLVLVLALRERAKIANTAGDFARGLRWAREAASVAAELGDRALVARCRMDMGDLLLSRGSLEEARTAYLDALADADALGLETDAAACHRSLGLAAYQAGDLAEAASEVHLALAQYQRRGLRWSVGFCQNLLGDIARQAGTYEAAERHYEDAIGCYRAVESGEIIIPMINLALSYTDQKLYSAARPVLEEGLASVRSQGRRGIEGCVHICLLPPLAAEADWAGWDEHYQRGEALLELTGFVETDVARMAERAGELAVEQGEIARARQAFALAQVQYWALDRGADAARVEGRARSLQ